MMVSSEYKIVGHRLCPYVQRVVITMMELGIEFEREDIDLDNKPAWLNEVSPNREVPVFRISTDNWLFESTAIARYLDRSVDGNLLPGDNLEAARHEAWIAYVDSMLSLVAQIIYRDADADAVARSMASIQKRLGIMEEELSPTPYFSGQHFGLLDIVTATLVRYLPVLNIVSSIRIEPKAGSPLGIWWDRVRNRLPVAKSVPQTYFTELRNFIAEKPSHAGAILERHGTGLLIPQTYPS